MGIKEKVKRGEMTPLEALSIIEKFRPIPLKLHAWLLRRAKQCS
jgi:hypothetical protein